MLIYKQNVLELLKNAGYNTNTIRKNKILGENILQYIREGKPVGPKALNTICTLLQCQPGDLLQWVPDTPEQSSTEQQIARRETISAALDDCAENLKLPWEV